MYSMIINKILVLFNLFNLKYIMLKQNQRIQSKSGGKYNIFVELYSNIIEEINRIQNYQNIIL